MTIGGLQKTSLIDFPGTVSAVVFARGCNFRCAYCHNPELVDPARFLPPIPEDEVFDFLRRRRGCLQGVTISGGEPCAQEDLPAFIEQIRSMGYRIKIDTNGSFPGVLETILARGWCDYAAMDVKGPESRYESVAGVPVALADIRRSIELIMDAGIPYEFRTTVVATQLSPDDADGLARMVPGARLFVLQRFVPSKLLRPELADAGTWSDGELERARALIARTVRECAVR